MPAGDDQAIRPRVDFEPRQGRVDRTDDEPARCRKSLTVAEFLTIIDDPHLEIDFGRQRRDSLPNVPRADNYQAATLEKWQVRYPLFDIRAGTLLNGPQMVRGRSRHGRPRPRCDDLPLGI